MLEFKENLLIKRRSKNLTQKEFSKISGVHYIAISKMERGVTKDPTLSTIKKIKIALGCSYDDLLGEG